MHKQREDELTVTLKKLEDENKKLKQIINSQSTFDPGYFSCDNFRDTLPFAIQATGLGLWSVDLIDLSVNWSSEMCAMLGLQRSDFLMENTQRFTVKKFLNYLHPDDRDHMKEEVEFSIAKHTQLNAVFRMRHSSGQYKWVHSVGYTAYLEDGTPRHMTGLVWDISEYKSAEEKLRELIVTDALTGLFNRRRMNEVLEHELSYSHRFGCEVSVVSIDIDHFKNINDTYGHEIGDRILKALANLMRRTFREVDYLFRWGGEEFVAILPNVSVKKAHIAAERLRKAFKSVNIEGAHTTLSAGVASSVQIEPGENSKNLLEASDRALYRAKRSGRDRVSDHTKREAATT